MGQYLCKPKYWHDDLLGAVTFGPRVGCQEIGCGSTYHWDDLGNVAWRFKDKAWKRGGALRVELEEFLDRAMERTEGAVEEPRLKCTASAFCCGGCWNPGFVTPELVEEFNKACEENKTKTRRSSIWVFNVGQSISEYARRTERSLRCCCWWKKLENTYDSRRANP